ncbi:hypothetical protein [Arenimonas sp. MALMAid1274]|uniref:hypothetical protein n=1 Tax=Arenimonas sp. MALMAid1274 TaxID=3411630 RepID=UPI003BA114CF
MRAWHAGFLLWGLHACFGVALVVFMHHSEADLALQALQFVLATGVLFCWASLDARASGQKLGAAQRVCLVVFGYLAVPFYLARYRRTSHWWRWLGKALAIFAGCLVFFVSAALLAAIVAALASPGFLG